MARTRQTPRPTSGGRAGHTRRIRPDPATPPRELALRPPRNPPRFIHPRDRPSPSFFSPFMRLPLEIRSKIWRTCFPGPRKVRMDLGVLDHKPTKLPCTLFINQESRRETLQQYRIVYPTDVLEYPSGPITPPFCFNFRTDTLFYRVTKSTTGSTDISEAFPIWLEYLGMHLSGGLKSITHLLVIYDHSCALLSSPDLENMLPKLTDLKDLFVQTKLDGETEVEVERILRSCLERNKDRFNGSIPPKLTMVPFG